MPPRHSCCVLWTLRLGSLFTAMILSGPLAAAEHLLTWQSDLRSSLSRAEPGDVFILSDGVWSDAVLELHAEGTAEKPVTLKAHSPGKVILTGGSRLRISGRYVVVEGLWFRDVLDIDRIVEFRTRSDRLAHRCRLTQCAITSTLPKDAQGDSKWVSLYGTENRVDHCYFAGKANEGQTLVVWVSQTPDRHRIDHNHFGPRPVLGKNGGETVRIGTSNVSLHDSLTVVEENYFEECDGEVEAVSNKSCGNVYRRNVFDRCSGTLTLRHGNHCLVEGNLFLGKGKRGSGGVRIVGEDHRIVNNYFEGLQGDGARAAVSFMNGVPDGELNEYAQVLRAVVAFNTVADCKVPLCVGIRASRATLPPAQCTVAHNVFLVGDRPLIEQQTAPIEWQWMGNLRQRAAGVSPMAGIELADLRFQRAENGLLRPAADSPAVDAATSEGWGVTIDIDGQLRMPPFDAGCDEVSSQPVPASILVTQEYGPAWRGR